MVLPAMLRSRLVGTAARMKLSDGTMSAGIIALGIAIFVAIGLVAWELHAKGLL